MSIIGLALPSTFSGAASHYSYKWDWPGSYWLVKTGVGIPVCSLKGLLQDYSVLSLMVSESGPFLADIFITQLGNIISVLGNETSKGKQSSSESTEDPIAQPWATNFLFYRSVLFWIMRESFQTAFLLKPVSFSWSDQAVWFSPNQWTARETPNTPHNGQDNRQWAGSFLVQLRDSVTITVTIKAALNHMVCVSGLLCKAGFNLWSLNVFVLHSLYFHVN